MAHPEILLLTRVIDDGAFQILEDNGLTSAHFSTEEGRHVYRVLTRAYHNQSAYGKTPSMDRVLHQVPAFAPVRVPDDTDSLVADIRSERLVGELAQLSNDIADMAERRQLTEAVALLMDKANEFSRGARKSKDLTLSSAVDVIEDRYNLVRDGGGLLGIPTPWEPMTAETLGFQPGQFIILYGRPGSMKSWMGILIAMHAYWANQRVLFYTREMEPVEIMQRVAAAATTVSWGAFRKGQLQPDLRDEVFAMLRQLAGDEDIIEGTTGVRKGLHVTNASDLKEIGNTVDGLARKVEEYKADIVVADGIYRMGDSRTHSKTVDWKNMYHISQDLKDTAQRLSVPIIGITQGSQRSGGRDIAYADAFLQDADLAFRVVLSKAKKQLTFITPKLREGVVPAFSINAIPASDFRLKAILDVDEAEKAIADEEAAEQKKNKKGGSGGGGTPRPAPRGPLRV